MLHLLCIYLPSLNRLPPPTQRSSSAFSCPFLNSKLAASVAAFGYSFCCKSIAFMSAYYYSGCSDHYEAHYLDACSLCRKSLHNSDIFMYRGNTPFCSKECRQEQMEIDEAREKNWKSGRSLRKSDAKNSASNKTVRTGTVAVA